MQTTDPGQASPATLHPDADGESKKRRTEGAVAPVTQHRGALSEEELKIELKVYYDRLFPTSFLFHWLSSMSPVDGLKYREMSFTLPGDIYVRYCSYVTKEALKNDLVSKLPIKIDIGAVYNAPPNMHASIANFAPVHKELVFDIDMTGNASIAHGLFCKADTVISPIAGKLDLIRLTQCALIHMCHCCVISYRRL